MFFYIRKCKILTDAAYTQICAIVSRIIKQMDAVLQMFTQRLTSKVTIYRKSRCESICRVNYVPPSWTTNFEDSKVKHNSSINSSHFDLYSHSLKWRYNFLSYWNNVNWTQRPQIFFKYIFLLSNTFFLSWGRYWRTKTRRKHRSMKEDRFKNAPRD